MESAIESHFNEFCETHPKKLISFVCMAPGCKKKPMACILCIKNFHNQCKDDFIITISQMAYKVDFKKPENGNETIRSRVNEIMELKLYELNKLLQSKKMSFLNSFKVNDSSEDMLADGVLENIKKNFNIEYEEATEKIVVTSKFDVTEEEIEDSIQSFQAKLEKQILNFTQEFDKLKLSIKGSLNAEDWISHANIGIENEDGGVLLKRIGSDQSFNYFCAMYTLPLEQPVKYKMTIKTIYEGDRFLDFGIIDENKFNSTKSGFINSFSSGGISYCGYSYSGGLTGKSLTSGSNDGSGFKPGSECIMDYAPGDKIRFYNEEGTLDMNLDMKSKTGLYYLFLVVYHPTASCLVEAIG